MNRKNVKISYSCCPNIPNIINSHNRNIFNDKKPIVGLQQENVSNCQQKQKCLLNKKCCIRCVIYKATQ